MATLGSVRIDQTKAHEGVWIEWEKGVRLLVARAGGARYDEAFSRAVQPKIRSTANGQVDVDRLMKLSLPIIAKHCFLGWQNIEEDDGTPILYSPEKALELLSDPRLDHLYAAVYRAAHNWERFAVAVRDENGNFTGEEPAGDGEGNSPTGSAGSSSGASTPTP